MEQQQQAGPLGPDVAVTHILVVADPGRSRDFWVNVLGAELYREFDVAFTSLVYAVVDNTMHLICLWLVIKFVLLK